MTRNSHAAFGDLLRQARRHAGLTQEALAERAGISHSAVSSLERGINRAPRRDTLELLCTALDLTSEEQRLWERTRRRLSAREQPASAAGRGGVPKHLPPPSTTLIGRQPKIATRRIPRCAFHRRRPT
jgi:transcriptional regulator with XRE-family HTH domain